MKPQANLARWKRFPAARALQIWNWLNGDTEKEIEPFGQRKVIGLIKKKWGVQLTPGDLSKFYSWYKLELKFVSLQQNRTNFEQLLLEKFPTLDPKAIQDFGQAWFTMQAASRGDAEEFRAMEELRLKKEKEQREASKLQLDQEKFEVTTCETFLKWYEDKSAVAIATMQVSHREKIARLRKKFFEDIDALQASGEIKLPE